MGYRVTIRLTGSDATLKVFDSEADEVQAKCKQIYRKYINNGWITFYGQNVESKTQKTEQFVFDTSQRWLDYREELKQATNDTNIGPFTREIIEEVEI